MSCAILPGLAGKKFIEVNLDQEARLRQAGSQPLRSDNSKNPFLDPPACEQFVEELTARRGVDFTYGGYLENRQFLWSGSYLDKTESYLHLGIDFNVPAGTVVVTPCDATVVLVDDDRDRAGGWGPRVILLPESPRPYLIFAHLADVEVVVGDSVAGGTVIAKIGRPPFNGNWPPHLHLQAVAREHFELLVRDNLEALDGYGNRRDLLTLPQQFPNPMQYSWLVGPELATRNVSAR